MNSGAKSGAEPAIIEFGAYEADLKSGELRRHGLKIKLRDKSFGLLAMLLEHPGEVVRRDELSKGLWAPGEFVDFENNLNAAVSALRGALKDGVNSPTYIETLPRRGYRFIAPVRKRTSIAAMAVPPKLRLVVLPFENLSGDPSQEYFSDGFTEELIGRLATIAPGRLAVIARTSAMHYKGTRKDIACIGSELQVDYILEGSVRRAGHRVRISAQLIEIDGQTHVWTDSYETSVRDVIQLQCEVACTIARQIESTLSTAGEWNLQSTYQVDAEAYDLYTRGLYHLNKHDQSGLEKGIGYLYEVVDRQPTFAPAYSKLAIAHAFSAFWGYVSPAQACPRAEDAAHRALDLNNELVDAHVALGFVHWFYHWRFADCQREYERAIEFSANDSTAHWHLGMFLSSMCEDPRALSEIEVAQQLDPHSLTIRSMSGWVYYWFRQYDRAIEQSLGSLKVDENCLQAYYVLGHGLMGKCHFQEAIAAFRKAFSKSGDPLSLSYLAMACGLGGRTYEARRILRQLGRIAKSGRYVPSICFASAYIGLRENDKALDWFEKTYAEHDAQVLWLRVSSAYESLHQEPRYIRLVAKLGLPAKVSMY
jgi:TolB-like protein